MGRGQVVRQRLLVPSFAGSNPAAPAMTCTKGDRSAFDISPSKQKTGFKAGFLILVLASYELLLIIGSASYSIAHSLVLPKSKPFYRTYRA